MANYPKELVDLLEQYMTDGVMTDKERAVLLRKAETMGVDKDEFDLFIDAEVQKFDLKIDAAKRQEKGKLCPFCEASIPMFADKCPECGGNITPAVTKELNEIIETLENAVVNFKSTRPEDFQKNKANVERYLRKAEMYYGNNKKIQVLIAEVKNEIELVEKRVAADKRKEIASTGATTFFKLLKNVWFWVIVEVIITMALYSHYDLKDQDAMTKYNTTEKESRSQYWDQHKSAEKSLVISTALGVITIIATSVYAITKRK